MSDGDGFNNNLVEYVMLNVGLIAKAQNFSSIAIILRTQKHFDLAQCEIFSKRYVIGICRRLMRRLYNFFIVICLIFGICERHKINSIQFYRR